MSSALVSDMHVMALLLRSERTSVGRLMILEAVCLIMFSLFSLEIVVIVEKQQNRNYAWCRNNIC